MSRVELHLGHLPVAFMFQGVLSILPVVTSWSGDLPVGQVFDAQLNIQRMPKRSIRMPK
jgi:hypothetical protein